MFSLSNILFKFLKCLEALRIKSKNINDKKFFLNDYMQGMVGRVEMSAHIFLPIPYVKFMGHSENSVHLNLLSWKVGF